MQESIDHGPQQAPSELECHLRGSCLIEARAVDSQKPSRQRSSRRSTGQPVKRGTDKITRQSRDQRTTKFASAVGDSTEPQCLAKGNLEDGYRTSGSRRELAPEQCPRRHASLRSAQFHYGAQSPSRFSRSRTFATYDTHADVRSRRFIPPNRDTSATLREDHRDSIPHARRQLLLNHSGNWSITSGV